MKEIVGCREHIKSKVVGNKDSERHNSKREEIKQRVLNQFKGIKGKNKKRKQNKVARTSLDFGNHKICLTVLLPLTH